MKKKAANNFILLYTITFALATFVEIFIILNLQAEGKAFGLTQEREFFSIISGVVPGKINLIIAENLASKKLVLVVWSFLSALIGRFCFEDKRYKMWEILSFVPLILVSIIISVYIYYIFILGKINVLGIATFIFYIFVLIYSIINYKNFF